MAGCWPEQSHGQFQDQNANPNSNVVTQASGQHQPTQRKKDNGIGDEMAKAGMAEGSTHHSP